MLRKNKSIIQFYDIVELGLQSKAKHNHLTRALKKGSPRILAMEEYIDIQETYFSNKRNTCNDDEMPRSQVVSNFS